MTLRDIRDIQPGGSVSLNPFLGRHFSANWAAIAVLGTGSLIGETRFPDALVLKPCLYILVLAYIRKDRERSVSVSPIAYFLQPACSLFQTHYSLIVRKSMEGVSQVYAGCMSFDYCWFVNDRHRQLLLAPNLFNTISSYSYQYIYIYIYMKPARGTRTMCFWQRLLCRYCCATSSGHLNVLSRAVGKNKLGGFGA